MLSARLRADSAGRVARGTPPCRSPEPAGRLSAPNDKSTSYEKHTDTNPRESCPEPRGLRQGTAWTYTSRRQASSQKEAGKWPVLCERQSTCERVMRYTERGVPSHLRWKPDTCRRPRNSPLRSQPSTAVLRTGERRTGTTTVHRTAIRGKR